MLVLSRRLHEKLVIPAVNTTIQIIAVKPVAVRLGIDAPSEVKVFREEILEQSALTEMAQASIKSLPPASLRHLLNLLNNRLNATALGLALLRELQQICQL